VPTIPKTYSTTCHLQCHSGTDYTICLDTGCTLSSTSSLDDFEEPPIHGCFGHLWMINHVVPIEAAGMIHWNVLDSKGQPAVIQVSGYYILTSGQCLLSPQSYAAYHKWAKKARNCYGGNDQQFWMHLAPAKVGAPCQLLSVSISALDGLPYIQGHSQPLASPCPSCTTHKPCAQCSHTHNLTVLLPHNENLTVAQKALLFNHQCLGHIGLKHMWSLYCCVTTTPTSIVESDCTPCIIPCHPQVLSCSAPICLACSVAKACKLPCATGCTSHATEGEQHSLSHNVLHPGQCIFMDQYKSSVHGHLATIQGLKSPTQ